LNGTAHVFSLWKSGIADTAANSREVKLLYVNFY
jgi:hypothetical protein